MTQWQDGGWSPAEVVLGDGQFSYGDPMLSNDGKRLFFISNRPLELEGAQPKDFDIWYVEREALGWGAPVNLSGPVNSDFDEYYISFASTGRIYFASNRGAEDRPGDFDLYAADLHLGKYETPLPLAGRVNTRHYEADVFVAPDESFVIYSSVRPGGRGRGDLYLSRRDAAGAWGEGEPLGAEVNTPGHELCPVVTPDRYLLFTSDQDIHWVDAGFLDAVH